MPSTNHRGSTLCEYLDQLRTVLERVPREEFQAAINHFNSDHTAFERFVRERYVLLLIQDQEEQRALASKTRSGRIYRMKSSS
jgi:hypothetical protein